MIGLVDGNNFFVSCERVFDPSLEGVPVAVLSNNDGCCISRSNELKKIGIAMGTPYFQLKPLMEKYGIKIRSSNYELYGDMSRRIIAILHERFPVVEQYSIDEAFVFSSPPPGTDFFRLGCAIRKLLLQWTGIPCGIGFAKTKTLAKIANHIGKKSPSGVFVMPDAAQQILEKIPTAEVWGVGRKLAPHLERLGIRNAWLLARQDHVEIKKTFSVSLARTVLELQGTSCIKGDNEEELSRSISCSRSFGKPATEMSEIEESIAAYTANAAAKLRKEKQFASGINIYCQFFPEHAPAPLAGGFRSCSVIFPYPTDDTTRIMQALRPKMKEIFIPGRRYKKTGVIFFGLEPAGRQPYDFFVPEKTQESSRLFSIVDKINSKYGKGTLITLGEGLEKPWQMKRDHLSRKFTTSWNDLLQVK